MPIEISPRLRAAVTHGLDQRRAYLRELVETSPDQARQLWCLMAAVANDPTKFHTLSRELQEESLAYFAVLAALALGELILQASEEPHDEGGTS